MSTDTTADVAPSTRQRISEALLEPFPKSLIKQKQGMDYISAEDIRYRLIQATRNQFSWTHDFWEIREADGVMRANQKSGLIPRVMVFGGTLAIPGLGERFGIGVQEMQDGQGADAAYKGAESDAFKRAAMAFGVGLVQLYMDSEPVQAAPPPKPKPEPIPPPDITTQTNDQFKQYVVERFAAKDIAALTNIVGQVGADTERGCLMVHATSTVKELDWLHKERDALKLAVDADVVREEMAKRQTFSDPKA